MIEVSSFGIECHERHFTAGLPTPFLTLDGMHAELIENGLKAFKEYAGTDRMVPNIISAVHEEERVLRFYPMNWRNEREKTAYLAAMRTTFQNERYRPDRYHFHGEVWIATDDPDNRDPRRPSERPDSLDGLSFVTVEAKTDKRLFTCYVRSQQGLVTKHCDSRDAAEGEGLTGLEGRLTELLKPIDGESTLGVIVL